MFAKSVISTFGACIALCVLPLTHSVSADTVSKHPASAHWSFIAPVRSDIPLVNDEQWCRNPIDHFVLAKLDSLAIKTSSQASKETLLRRVSLDLVGLPPTPAEIDAFLADNSPDAYEKVVDRLLASPHYGERWGRHWLDAARYADSNGYSIDAPRVMWKYRDWVIDALNRDIPFDQFTIEQIAGDMLPNATIDQKIATGFHRNTQINEEGGIDPEQFRVEAIIDRVNTTGSVWLGLTIGCAQCHDHKFDPFTQKDYYSLFDFFNQCDEPTLKLPTPALVAREQDDREQIAALEDAKYELSPSDKHGAEEIQRQISAFREEAASIIPTALVMAQRKSPRQTFIFTKGDFTRHADRVTAAVPAILSQIKTPHPTRLDLARWLVDPSNPLTARVTVNRIWQHYFGAGLVETENDFGTQGAAPSNQPLLDWLACEFVQPTQPGGKPWSLKSLHRLIVTSATYRQSSSARADLAEVDPYNHLLARQSRVRVDAEIVRDIGLCASGLLCDRVGGPSVFPPQPAGVMNTGQISRPWHVSAGPDRYRRGIYTFLFRATPHPLLTSFDATNATATCTRRLRSNTPLQALIELNDEASIEFARAMAQRVLKECTGSDVERVEYAFRLATSRKPDQSETDVLLRLLKKEQAAPDAKPLAAWIMVSRVILNLDETVTRE